MRVVGLLALAVWSVPARAHGHSCNSLLSERMELELVRVEHAGRIVARPDGLPATSAVVTDGVNVDVGAWKFAQRRREMPPRAVIDRMTAARADVRRRTPTTSCGDPVVAVPIVPGVYAGDGMLLWIAPGRDRVELRGRFEEREVRAVYAVRCARFPGPERACTAGEPSPLRLDWDVPPAPAGRCSTGDPGLCGVLLLARRRRRRWR